MTMAEHQGVFKTPPSAESGMSQSHCGNAVDIVGKIGALPINSTAKLVGLVMRTTRIFDSRKLAEITGLSIRVVQKSKNDYVAAIDEAGELGFAELSEQGERSEPEFASGTNPANQDSFSDQPRVHAPAQMESPSEIVTPEIGKIPPFAPKPDFWGRPPEGEKDAFFDGSDLILTEAERADWLPKFGDAERLDLALTQAAAFVQVNSRRPLLVQVRAQLARAAGDKIDRDQRYAKAAQAKPTAQASPARKTWADDRNDKARAFLALLKPTEAVQ